jgi:AcrR family transcriptional regulator
MAEQGYAGASINAIVKEAGIPISSVYHYFGSKDGVLLAVMERGAERFLRRPPRASPSASAPPSSTSPRMARALEAALGEHPDFLKLVVVMAAQPPAGEAAHAREVVTRVRDMALRRLRKQLGLAFDIDPRGKLAGRLARLSLAVVDGAFIAIQADPHVKLATFIEPLPAALVALRDALDVQASGR